MVKRPPTSTLFFFKWYDDPRDLPSSPTRRSSELGLRRRRIHRRGPAARPEGRSAAMTARSTSPRIPATIVTGFLGAGKTTLIRHLLAHAQGRRIGLIVNEFGDRSEERRVGKECRSRWSPYH